MRLKATILLVVLSLFATSAVAKAANRLTATRVQTPIAVDGDSSDWKEIPVELFRSEGISLAAAHDGQYLYLTARFKQPEWLLSMARQGVTLWPNARGKKKKELGLQYFFQLPEQALEAEMAKRRARGNRGNRGTNQGRSPQRPAENRAIEERIVITDAIGARTDRLAIDGSAGPAGSLSVNQGVYTCEFRIPLTAAGEAAFSIPAAAGDTIRLGLFFGGEHPERGSRSSGQRGRGGQRGGGGGGRGGGLGGGPGGGMGGGMGKGGSSGGGQGPRGPLPASGEEIWVKIQLS